MSVFILFVISQVIHREILIIMKCLHHINNVRKTALHYNKRKTCKLNHLAFGKLMYVRGIWLGFSVCYDLPFCETVEK